MKVGDLIYYKRSSFSKRYLGIITRKRTLTFGGVYHISVRKSDGTYGSISTFGKFLTRVKTNEGR